MKWAVPLLVSALIPAVALPASSAEPERSHWGIARLHGVMTLPVGDDHAEIWNDCGGGFFDFLNFSASINVNTSGGVLGSFEYVLGRRYGIEARAMAERLRAKAEQNNNKGSLAEALQALGHVQRQTGDLEAAQGYWQQALFLAHETGRRMLLWRLHAALAEVARSKELASVHNQIAAEIIRQIANPIEDLELRQKFLDAEAVSDVLNQSTDGWGRLSRS